MKSFNSITKVLSRLRLQIFRTNFTAPKKLTGGKQKKKKKYKKKLNKKGDAQRALQFMLICYKISTKRTLECKSQIIFYRFKILF